jgi:hypothetical protein
VRVLTLRALCAALGACLVACGGGGAAAVKATPSPSDPNRPLPSPVPEIVARVNGQPVSIRQVLPMAVADLERVPEAEKDRAKPRVVREALRKYVDRELLLQEALARGVQADRRDVQWSYDQFRQLHADAGAWREFLVRKGLDEESLRAELRVQATVSALLAREIEQAPLAPEDVRALYERDPGAFAPEGATTAPEFEAVRDEVAAALRNSRREEVSAALLERLRARARIEILI